MRISVSDSSDALTMKYCCPELKSTTLGRKMSATVMPKTFLQKHSALNRMNIFYMFSGNAEHTAQIRFKAIRLLVCVLTRMFAPE